MSAWQVAIGGAVLLAGCGEDGKRFVVIVNPGAQPPVPVPAPSPPPQPAPPRDTVRIAFSFQRDAHPWQPVIADYPAGQAAAPAVETRLAPLPRELGPGGGFMLAGDGVRGGVFSGLWRRIDGLRPYTSYRIEFTLTLASNLARDCTGRFARAAEAQVVKAGASGVVPEPVRSGFVRLPLDKGPPSGSGRDMVAVGDLAVPGLLTCALANRFHARTFASDGRGPVVATDSVGRLWLIAGVDSRYDGPFRYYVLDGRFTLTPA